MFEDLKHNVEKSKQKLNDNNDSWTLIKGVSYKFSGTKLTLKSIRASSKKIKPKIKAIRRYHSVPSFNSDNFIFSIINTNKKRTAIAPTYTIKKRIGKNSTFKINNKQEKLKNASIRKSAE